MLESLVSGTTAWFAVPAIVGTVVFVLKLFGMMLGIDELDLDVPGGDAASAAASTEQAFEILSINSLAAFAMGAGWSGYTGLTLFDWSLAPSLVLALAGGGAMVWLFAWGLRRIMALQSSGNIALADAVGKQGNVVVQVPPEGEGSGRVRVIIGERAREFDAVSSRGDPIVSRTRVTITGLGPSNSIVVVPVTKTDG